jgi:4-oxalocrotonate tautomerase
MPFVRIDTLRGRYTDTQRKAMGESVYQALRDVGVPEGDRFQVLSEKAPGELVFDPPGSRLACPRRRASCPPTC